MPLPLPEDVFVFYQLRLMSKNKACSKNFSQRVTILASEFTRPNLASNLDMATGYVLTQEGRVKYAKGDGTSKDSPMTCRMTVMTNYTKILKDSSGAANEITIAYRKYGTANKYPCFVIRSLELLDHFIELRIRKNFNSHAGYEMTGNYISRNNYTETRQAADASGDRRIADDNAVAPRTAPPPPPKAPKSKPQSTPQPKLQSKPQPKPKPKP